MDISQNNNSRRNHSVYIWIVLFIIIIMGLFFLIRKNNFISNSETGQVIMLKEVVAGSNQEYVLKQGSEVQVSKEYFLPQILLPGTIGGMKRFDTPPPIYHQVGTGVYFDGNKAKEIVPFKGKLRQGAFADALSMGFLENRLIVYGSFIILIFLLIFIINKLKKNGKQ